MARLWTLLLLAAGTAAQAAYPDKPIRLVVGFPPGGGADYVARQVAAGLTQALGQSVVVDNKPGANGTTAAAEVARAAPDGYTLLLGVTATQSIAPVLYPKLPYDALRDFTPVTEIGFTPMVLVVNPQLPVKSVAEFIRFASDDANRATYASAGIGNITHLAAELFVQSTGAGKILHVPYKGSSPAITDLLGGRISAYFDTLPSSLPFIQDGKLRALGVTSAARAAALPEVPTIAETGVKNYEAIAWFGVLGPANLSPEIAQRLYEALHKSLGSGEMKQQLGSRGVDTVLEPPARFRSMLEADLARWRRVAENGRIKLD
ncbi:MAG: tripartite tricarboxylate transporter substrate binding protein [Rubrivivax sp.]